MQSYHFLARDESIRISFNVQSGYVVLKSISGIKLFYVKNNAWKEFELNSLLKAPLPYEGLIRIVGVETGSNYAKLLNVDAEGNEIESLEISVDVCKVALKNDSNRDGIVDYVDDGNSNWVWGQEQNGAILLVNNDKDISDVEELSTGYSEWSRLIVEDTELDNLPDGSFLALYATENAAKKFTVYRINENNEPVHVLGKKLANGEEETISISSPLSLHGEELFIEAHEYPGSYFEGLITVELLLINDQSVIASDSVVFRVAPWIMTPNTLKPKMVFACRIISGENDNERFLSDLSNALSEINVPITIIEPQDHLGDRWIQDEIEFGYVKSPTHTLPVVLDSPRDRGLDDFPEKRLLGEDFGHFQIGGSTPNSLDSFGNLEVSPPTTVNGRRYPFGRIVFGGRKYGDYSDGSRQMMPQIRKFLYSQKIQSPFEIYTDWLSVGHVDEIICFVPAQNEKGFELLIASPDRCKAILQRLEHEGYGNVVMFKGMKRGEPNSPISAEITVHQLLNDVDFWADNEKYQQHLDFNQEILMKELEVDDRHIIRIPALFHPAGKARTAAYFPDMINHLVLGNASLVPKPHGPVIESECQFERAFKEAVPNRRVIFIEDWYSYHEMLGEVHCGTNTLREPFNNKVWWDYKPDGGYNI